MDNYHESMDYTFCPIFRGQFVYALVVFSGSKLIHLFFLIKANKKVKLRVTQFKEQRSRRSVAHQRGDIEESRRASYDESGNRRSHPPSGTRATKVGMAQSMALDVSRGAIIRRPRSSSGQSGCSFTIALDSGV